MTIGQYRTLRNFTEDEGTTLGGKIVDEVGRIDLGFMSRLDWCVTKAKTEFGEEAGKFIVHCFTGGKHSESGYHPRGRAVDGHWKWLTRAQAFTVAALAGFKGIGIYPDGNGGAFWHLDDRGGVAI